MDIRYATLGYLLTDAEKSFIEDKLLKLSHLIEPDSVINIKIKEEKKGLYKIEISVAVQDVIIRVSKTDTKFYNCVEDTVLTLKEKINRYKDKSKEYFIGNRDWDEFSEERHEEMSDMEYRPIVKVKKYEDDTPIHPQEAIERMILLGHDSYLFKNIETGKYSMVYKREDGISFGLVEPS